MEFTFKQIGIIKSCFKEKFGIPRQSGLIPEARATLELIPPFNRKEALKELDGFSHIWIIFVFHKCPMEKWNPTVRPPRLGGNRRIGVFSTRSGFRPNAIGMSVAELEYIEEIKGHQVLHLKGIDILDGTPVLDIKPYLPYADIVPLARPGFAEDVPSASLKILFENQTLEICSKKEQEGCKDLKKLIEQIIKHDPRPAYHNKNPLKNSFGFKIFDLNVQCVIEGNQAKITSIQEISS